VTEEPAVANTPTTKPTKTEEKKEEKDKEGLCKCTIL